MEATVVNGSGTEAGQIIATTIAGRNGQPKQVTWFLLSLHFLSAVLFSCLSIEIEVGIFKKNVYFSPSSGPCDYLRSLLLWFFFLLAPLPPSCSCLLGRFYFFWFFLDAFCGLVVEYDLQQLHAHVYMKICILGCTNFPC